MKKQSAKQMGFSNTFEKRVYEKLNREFSQDHALIIHNRYFTWPNGDKSEADLIMITQRGIFVIECKDYSGYVEGTDYDGDFRWRHIIEKKDGTKVEYPFENPLYQNYKHIQCMEINIDCSDIPVYSLVVFADTCDISKVRFSRPDTAVTSFGGMCGQIVILSSNSPRMMSNQTIHDLRNKLMAVSGSSQENKEIHVKRIKAKKLKHKKKVMVRYTGNPTKKGLETGKAYVVLEDDGEYYKLKGISGKSYKTRFEIM